MTQACGPTSFFDGEVLAGVAMPIAQARLMINRQRLTNPVTRDDDAAVFTVELPAGQTLLHTWFYDERNQLLCGAYDVYVARLD